MPAVKTYTRVNFQNYPSTSTPLNATNLNKLDKGIDDLDDEVVTVKNAIENMNFDADAISYNNTQSGLQATDVQGAVDEINDNLTWYIQNGWLPVRPSGDVPANMEDCSWAMLKQLASAGTLGNYYQIGDTKTIELTGGERVVMELVSINDGSGSAGAYYPRGTVDFISKDCMIDNRVMNNSNTNAGGWVSCALRTTLNSTIYETLPQTVKDAIVEKTHKTSAGSQSTSLIEHTDKLWLPTDYEMMGLSTGSTSTENTDVNKHYAIFNSQGSRIKHKGTNGSATAWWLCSPFKSNITQFCGIDATGSNNNYNAAESGISVPLCFRIGQLYT